jgi:pyruvate kinase
VIRTKIVCTLGPATDSEDTIQALVEAGMTVARINFSHGTHEDHARQIAFVRRAASEGNRAVAVLADLQGPKLRVGTLPGQQIELVPGRSVRLALADASQDPGMIPIPHAEVLRDVEVGDRILLDDGILELQVTDVTTGREAEARVVAGGPLSSRKGLSLPHTKLKMPSVTAKDQVDARFALEQGADYFALSFVRCDNDVQHLRGFLRDLGSTTPIIAKIEKPEALDCIEAILAVSDGLMVARGDLGVEAPVEEVPMIQKQLIRLCNQAGKPVITATHMLESMMRNPRPTRAEASDVANAILDGSDAVMLSGETAVGRYPLASVQTMARIAALTEKAIPYDEWLRRAFARDALSVTESIGQVASEMAAELGAAAIITSTVTGSTARRVASHRPVTPIVAPTPRLSTYRELAMVWGVVPLLVDEFNDTDTMIVTATAAARQQGLVKDGDVAIITAGVPLGGTGLTNMVKVHQVGEEKGWR